MRERGIYRERERERERDRERGGEGGAGESEEDGGCAEREGGGGTQFGPRSVRELVPDCVRGTVESCGHARRVQRETDVPIIAVAWV